MSQLLTANPVRVLAAAAFVAALSLAAAERAGAASFVVTKTADTNDGVCGADCSFREAIVAANAAASPPHSITFSIPGAGPHTIAVGSALPTLAKEIDISAAGEAIAGAPGVRLSGAGLASGSGLSIGNAADGSSVAYLSITDFPEHGISIASQADNVTVTDCYVGVAPDGVTDAGNGTDGIRVAGANAAIGTSILDGNLISGNGFNGITIVNGGSNATVHGNYIGTNAAGTSALPNGGDGVHGTSASNVQIGGASALFSVGNVISGNTGDGILLDSTTSGWTIRGNNLGADATGAAPLGNGGDGIDVSGDSVVIGGTSTSGRNIISANAGYGVLVQQAANLLAVHGNHIGLNGVGNAVVGSQAMGLRVFGTNCTIGGDAANERNVIAGHSGVAISLESVSSGCVVSGNYLGTDATGTVALGNDSGISLGGSNHVVGGDTAGERNVISGNTGYGIALYGSGNKVQGNYIGVDATGAAALPNESHGIRALVVTGATIGGTAAGEGNVISGNGGSGVIIDSEADAIVVQGNFIGTDPTGTAAIPNQGGIGIGGTNHVVGGAAAGAGNVISGNHQGGVGLFGTGNSLKGNRIGTNAAGTAALANDGIGVRVINATNCAIGGTVAGEGNVISGNTSSGVTLEYATTGCTVRGNKIGTNLAGDAAIANAGGGIGLGGSGNTIGGTTAAARNVISGNPFGGIGVDGSNHVIQGNYIGTNAAGTAAIPGNASNGIRVLAASGVTIGGTAAGAGNLISGNGGAGIAFDAEASSCIVQGNLIGTNAAGNAAIPNATGVGVGGTGQTIGGATAAARNVISGNSSYGIFAGGSGHFIRGNYVGVNAAGTAALGNGSYGLRADTLVDSVIGGDTAAEGNVFGGNGRGVNFGYESHGNALYNNIIGLDATATVDLADNATGIEIGDSFDNWIGAPGKGNVIAGMTYSGIGISGPLSTGNVIQGNWIGTNKVAATTLGNDFAGIHVVDSSGNTIGGTGAGEGNVIAHNYQFGVWVERGEDNEISGNSIYGNYFGIDVDQQGFFPNDGGDGDDGGNRAQNYPLISSAVVNGGATDVEGLLINEPNTSYRVEFFSSPDCGNAGFGQGKTFRGSTQVVTNGGGQAVLATSIPQAIADAFLTATVTDPLGNTSEFSPCAQVNLGESPGRFQFDRDVFMGYEGILPTSKVIVTRSHGLSGTATVSFTTSNGSAVAGADYTDSDQTLTFEPWEVVKHVEVPILLELAAEPDHEDVLLALTAPTGGATLGSPATAEIQIIDFTDDWPGLTVSDAHVVEGDGEEVFLTFDVNLTATDHQVKVTYLTEEGTALEGVDYEAAEAVLTFPPSASTQTQQVQISILGETDVEPDEIVWLRITTAGGGGNWIAYDVFGRGEIRNDDDNGVDPPPSNVIFADSFEVGSTALWSNTVPQP